MSKIIVEFDRENLEAKVSAANGGLPWRITEAIEGNDTSVIFTFHVCMHDKLRVKAQSDTRSASNLYAFSFEGEKETVIKEIQRIYCASNMGMQG